MSRESLIQSAIDSAELSIQYLRHSAFPHWRNPPPGTTIEQSLFHDEWMMAAYLNLVETIELLRPHATRPDPGY